MNQNKLYEETHTGFFLLLASLFFVTYEAMKRLLGASNDKQSSPFIYMTAASCGEIVSFLSKFCFNNTEAQN